MGKRSNKPNTDADSRQDELDLGHGEGENGTLSAPTGAASGADRLSADAGGEARSAAEGAGAAASPPLPALPFDGPLDIGMGLHGADSIGSMRSFRIKRIAALAAAVAFAAALGALAGSLATSGLGPSSTAVNRTSAGEASLRLALERMEQELTTLRTNVEKSAQNLEERTNRIAKSLDRVQAEPSKKLAKISAAIARLERRATGSSLAAAGAADVTGAIGPRGTAPPIGRATIVRGWTLRDVRNGAALIEGRDGLIHVVPGDRLPGLGKIHTIRRRNGRWVVVTARGLIVGR